MIFIAWQKRERHYIGRNAPVWSSQMHSRRELFEGGRDHGRGVRERVNVDFPIDLLRAIDADARCIGVTRQAWIKMRLAETLTTK